MLHQLDARVHAVAPEHPQLRHYLLYIVPDLRLVPPLRLVDVPHVVISRQLKPPCSLGLLHLLPQRVFLLHLLVKLTRDIVSHHYRSLQLASDCLKCACSSEQKLRALDEIDSLVPVLVLVLELVTQTRHIVNANYLHSIQPSSIRQNALQAFILDVLYHYPLRDHFFLCPMPRAYQSKQLR